MQPRNSDASRAPTQVSFASPNEPHPSASSHLGPRHRTSWFSKPAFIFSVFILLGAGVAMCYAWFTRPVSAHTRLLVRAGTFGDAADAAEFVASVNAVPSLIALNERLPAPLGAQELAEIFHVEFSAAESSVIISASADNASTARRRAAAMVAHATGFAEEWNANRTSEVDGQVLRVEKRLHELRDRFSGFDSALSVGDMHSLQQKLEKAAVDQNGKAELLRIQLAALEVEERKLIASAKLEQPALRSLEQELQRALARYTEEHPQVKELRASIAAVEKDSEVRIRVRLREPLEELHERREALRSQLESAETAGRKSSLAVQTFGTNAIELTRAQSEFAALASRRDELIQTRVAVANKGLNLLQPSNRITTVGLIDHVRLGQFALMGAFSGIVLAGTVTTFSKRRSGLIRDAAGLEKATGLPMLAELPLLTTMSAGQREYWGVETLERLRHAATGSRDGCFVCGVISASGGEGRTTWIDLLARAGLRSGYRVLVIDQGRPAFMPNAKLPAPAQSAPDGTPVSLVPAVTQPTISRCTLNVNSTDLPFRENWNQAMQKWQDEKNMIVLVELPPADTAEALLQSRSVPNVLWLGAVSMAHSSKTLRCVAGLRNTGCNLIGAALNMCSASTRLWMLTALLLFAGMFNGGAQTNPTNTPPVTNAIFRSKTPVLDPWQQRLTLGPGDTVDVSLYGQPETLRAGLTIAPDGRFSYLQATDFIATGLTVDELRNKLEDVLGKFHLSPRVVVVPQSFRSKKYYVLGNVAQRGVFPLDRPTTVLEAVARARGFVATGQQRSSYNLADLGHSFLMRRRADGTFSREPVDFEGLFLRGELQHNKFLAPDDYLYFPPLGVEEVYVLGEARGVGVVPFVPNLTALAAIAQKGGFSENAFRQKILIVRGSLERPETFVIDLQETLRAQALDFVLQPRDIVYVHRQPWTKAEELLEGASSDFVRAIAITWAGENIGSFKK